MNRTTYSIASLALVLVFTLAGSVSARQHQQHHRGGGAQAPEAQPSDTAPETPQRGQMMGQMQGMMENMQGMMENMQGMMGMMGRKGMRGQGGQMGMMGRRGMMTEAGDDDENIPGGGMMGRMMGRGHKMGHGGKFLRHLKRLTQQLDLTDEQQIQVRSLARSHMKKAIRSRADMAVNRLDLHALLEAETVELPKVKELLQAIALQKADLHFAHITLKQEIGKLLTPEQQKKFRSIRRHMMRGDRGKMGRGGKMGSGGMRGRGGMMGRGGMQGQGSMKNPCGMTGSGTSKQ